MSGAAGQRTIRSYFPKATRVRSRRAGEYPEGLAWFIRFSRIKTAAISSEQNSVCKLARGNSPSHRSKRVPDSKAPFKSYSTPFARSRRNSRSRSSNCSFPSRR